MALPLPLFPCLRQGFVDNDGAVLAGGQLRFFITGTSTPKAVYADQNGSALGTTVTLDADGTSAQIYGATDAAYKVEIYDGAAVLQRTIAYATDVAAVFLYQQGLLFSAGSKGISAASYAVVATDFLITFDGTGVQTCTLPLVTARTQDITIKNEGASGTVAISSTSPDTIDSGIGGNTITIPAAGGPSAGDVAPTITLRPDGTSNWSIVSGWNGF